MFEFYLGYFICVWVGEVFLADLVVLTTLVTLKMVGLNLGVVTIVRVYFGGLSRKSAKEK